MRKSILLRFSLNIYIFHCHGYLLPVNFIKKNPQIIKIIFSLTDYNSKHHEVFVDALCPHIEYIDFSYVLQAKKIDHTFSLTDLIEFSLENLSSKHTGISITAATIIRQLTNGLIKFDQEKLNQKSSEDYNESDDDEENLDNYRWHILESFRDTLESYQEIMKDLSEDFR